MTARSFQEAFFFFFKHRTPVPNKHEARLLRDMNEIILTSSRIRCETHFTSHQYFRRLPPDGLSFPLLCTCIYKLYNKEFE